MSDKEKTQAQLLKEQLLIELKNAGERMTDEELDAADHFCEGYKRFLDAAKTEREAVNYTIGLLEQSGFVPFEQGKQYSAGDRVYYNNRGKALIFATLGKRPLSQGARIVASHIDSPRLDLKPRPLYEQAQLALFKTHYYGGIKKYQWAAVPLALHGVIVRADGSLLEVNIGEDDNDPVFCVTDLLPHLSAEQYKRTLNEGIKGEELNILVGSRMFRDDKESERVKLGIAKLLFDKYRITEHDFLSAELSAVPAHKARDLGFDRSMVGAYGQDDRVCAYTSIIAGIESVAPEYTGITVLADKEETGSEGNTGLQSAFLRYFIADLAEPHGIKARTVLSRSECMSADVNVAFDPTFPDVSEKNNTAYLNYGVVVTKYTGARGKSDTNDASAEFTGKVRRLLDKHSILWQTGELGKVDIGGGGTVAKYVADLDVEVIDIGVPVLSMHAPLEVVAKPDVYSAYRAFHAFLEDNE